MSVNFLVDNLAKNLVIFSHLKSISPQLVFIKDLKKYFLSQRELFKKNKLRCELVSFYSQNTLFVVGTLNSAFES